MATFHLDEASPHAFWDHSHPARLTVAPGDTVVFETLEATGQVGPGTDSELLANLQPDLIHPLTGPVEIEGAEPGDVLEVEVLALEHKGWGWNGVIPGNGLLAEDFVEPYIHHYVLDGETCVFDERISIPFEPFCGVMGVAPADAGRFDTTPPRRNGGNVDIRHLGPGSRLYLPVLVPGALFSCGDCHAAQGDGEVNGTGIESPMTVSLRFGLQKDRELAELQFTTAPGKPLTRAGEAGYFATTAHGPDLHELARTAIRSMLDYIVDQYGLTRPQAYCLSGAVVDLKISEVVNEPNWVVSAYLPLAVFKERVL